MVGAETPKGVVLVLLPVGRDAATVAGLIERTGLRPVICHTLREVVENLECVVEVTKAAQDAEALGIRPEAAVYTPLGEWPTATDKARRDAAALPVTQVG